ncbi:hypothetical protein [Foetidibacter luteolus]|uniref:hypothetical protein n=1 Tax=Foetidibacter luteolus TaxID=2608880 RepID=UPI00129B9A1A|nr:hypothetical protein [Foetidibacter luteolus]
MKYTPLQATEALHSDAKEALRALKGLQQLEYFERIFSPGEQGSIKALATGMEIKANIVSVIVTEVLRTETTATMTEEEKKAEIADILKRTNARIETPLHTRV